MPASVTKTSKTAKTDEPFHRSDAAKTARMKEVFYRSIDIAKSLGRKSEEISSGKNIMKTETTEYSYKKWGLEIRYGIFEMRDNGRVAADSEYVEVSYKGKPVFEALIDSYGSSFSASTVSVYIDTLGWQSRLEQIYSTTKIKNQEKAAGTQL